MESIAKKGVTYHYVVIKHTNDKRHLCLDLPSGTICSFVILLISRDLFSQRGLDRRSQVLQSNFVFVHIWFSPNPSPDISRRHCEICLNHNTTIVTRPPNFTKHTLTCKIRLSRSPGSVNTIFISRTSILCNQSLTIFLQSIPI